MEDIYPIPAGITLPSAFSPATPASLRIYIGACLKFLASPLVTSLLECHPNDIAVEGPRSEWLGWWNWASRGGSKWARLVPGWPLSDEKMASAIPHELAQILDTIDTLSLPRNSTCNSATSPLHTMRGMSSKKSHEVSEMSAIIRSLVSQSNIEIKHVVDVGAGQGYLSRALSEPPHSMNVLALDFSEVQIKGAERRGRNIKNKRAIAIAKNTVQENTNNTSPDVCATALYNGTVFPVALGTLTHKVIHINPRTLTDSVKDWLSNHSSSSTPILLVGLHACGSLTPDILRCFLACRSRMSSPDTPQQNWYPAGLVVVGCCYNLMSEETDFPMSKTLLNEIGKEKNRISLSYNYRSLAAQYPSQWALSPSARAAAEMAIRKVVYRALLGRQVFLNISPKDRPEGYRKVGRLHDPAYCSLQSYISHFNAKNGSRVPIPVWDEVQYLASSLEVLHVLRSRIGPVVESLILVDRWLYLAENLPSDDVLVINLFDLMRGSVRNVALVVRPRRI